MKIGFIGTGKIAAAVVEAICTSGMKDYRICLSPRNAEISVRLSDKYEMVYRKDSNQDVIDDSEVIFISLRPPVFKNVLAELDFRKDQHIVSVIPFSFYSDLASLVEPATSISRATPLPTVVTHTCPIPVFMPVPAVMRILENIGQPFEVKTEQELHTIWTLTCLISPYYDLLASLSRWAADNAVAIDLASKYVADMFNTLSYAAHIEEKPDFGELSHHAATPGGLNEKAAKEIDAAGAHEAYLQSAQNVLSMFKPK